MASSNNDSAPRFGFTRVPADLDIAAPDTEGKHRRLSEEERERLIQLAPVRAEMYLARDYFSDLNNMLGGLDPEHLDDSVLFDETSAQGREWITLRLLQRLNDLKAPIQALIKLGGRKGTEVDGVPLDQVLERLLRAAAQIGAYHEWLLVNDAHGGAFAAHERQQQRQRAGRKAAKHRKKVQSDGQFEIVLRAAKIVWTEKPELRKTWRAIAEEIAQRPGEFWEATDLQPLSVESILKYLRRARGRGHLPPEETDSGTSK